VGIDIDLNVGDIRHPHLFFRYRRQICRTENCHSDVRNVPISTSESIPISDIKETKIIPPGGFEPTPPVAVSEYYTTQLLYHTATVPVFKDRDVGYRIKLNSDI
jgi:hypothetical protein